MSAKAKYKLGQVLRIGKPEEEAAYGKIVGVVTTNDGHSYKLDNGNNEVKEEEIEEAFGPLAVRKTAAKKTRAKKVKGAKIEIGEAPSEENESAE